jgi:hypothetical protein
MKKLYKAGLLAALGFGSITAAQAQSSDVLLGFNDLAGPTSAQNDYVIDLGPVSTALVNGNSWSINSSIFTTAFINTKADLSGNTLDSNWQNNVAVGVVEAYSGGYPKTLYYTAVTPKIGFSNSQMQNSLVSVQNPTIGEYASSSGSAVFNAWSQYIAQDPNTVGYVSTGFSLAQQMTNPLQYLSSGVVTETLYESSKASLSASYTAFAAVGTFTINANNDTITYAVTPAPEPTTYGLAATAGLLMLTFRRKFTRNNA